MTLSGVHTASQRQPAGMIARSSFLFWAGAILVTSGIAHLLWLWLTGAAWEGPLSPRKPGLFGLSAGVTVWSLEWVLTRLHPHRLDRLVSGAMGCGLLLEVGLITLQHWRGVPSHFNRTTIFDAAIETLMLALIVLVTAGIVWLTWRSRRLPPMEEATAVALRGGLWLLTLSCALGLGVTILGEVNLAAGKPPEVWGPAGVLKYPHGAALHAIQTLPLLAWLCGALHFASGARVVRAAVWSHFLLLGSAVWQTIHGRARFDWDGIGFALFVAAGLVLLPAAVSCWAEGSKRYSGKSP